jgi:Ca2+-binding RTX toxin-like protein
VAHARRTFRPTLEPLEDRRTPAAYVSGTTLVIDGTLGNDVVQVAENRWWPNGSGQLLGYDVTINGQRTFVPDFEGAIQWARFSGYDGHDSYRSWLQVIPNSADGGDGDDTLIGGTSRDILFGGPGHDHLNGWTNQDVLYGEGGNDYLVGDEGNDYLYGGDLNDTLVGGAGDDRLYGGYHDDALYGGTGCDQLYGENGDDYLDGGADLVGDYLYGGAGADTFKSETVWFLWSSWNNDNPQDCWWLDGDRVV